MKQKLIETEAAAEDISRQGALVSPLRKTGGTTHLRGYFIITNSHKHL